MPQRVLFSDSVNGKPFNFAIIYHCSRYWAVNLAMEEFPNATIVEVTNVCSPE